MKLEPVNNDWIFPLPDYEILGCTNNSMSFLEIDTTKQVELPIGDHVGAFGSVRRYDVHKGIDLYCSEWTPVVSCQHGIVVDICPFTGPKAGFPWWNDTDAVYVVSKSGILVYGEIIANPNLKIGQVVFAGDLIGNVTRVLKKDKGRPTTMLHFEWHEHHVPHTKQWEIGKEQPDGLKDPIWFLTLLSKKGEVK
jgi:hypothetical protein